MMTYHTHFTDAQKRVIQALPSHEIGGFHATHGLAQDFKCPYCDIDYIASFDAFHYLVLDHIIPQCHGGEHTEENTVACCRACNFLKHMYKPTGNSREERIADARLYVQKQRASREAGVAKIRLLVRGDLQSEHYHVA
jgi:5-methylcytosine-specific restriction endonuclease McrA